MFSDKNITLVGLMGAGKTTLGKKLASRFRIPFYDSDDEIKNATGVSVATIFDIEGEAGFRKREAETIARLTAIRPCVIATGGGAVMLPENRAALQKSDVVVYLNVLPEALWQRLRHDRTRPLLQVADPLQKLCELHLARDPLYREVADVVVDTSRTGFSGLLRSLFKATAQHQGNDKANA